VGRVTCFSTSYAPFGPALSAPLSLNLRRRKLSLSTPYNRNLHRFAGLTAFATFLLIVAGALAISTDAGLYVPDWPTSIGSMAALPSVIASIRFDQANRLVAEIVGVLATILALWIGRDDRRPWMRKLAFAALAAVIIQALLSGLAVLKVLPAGVSSVHTTLAQTFFCLIVAIWLFTGRIWVQEPRQNLPSRRPSIQVLTALSVSAIYIQLILGAAFRHHGIKLLPHILCAAIVTFVVLWTVVRVLTEYPKVDQLRRPAVALLSLLMVQLGLGFAAWVMRIDTVPGLASVWVTAVHVALGALFLATAVVLAIQAWRHVAIPTPDRIPHREPRAVAI
jgi:heme A synthase